MRYTEVPEDFCVSLSIYKEERTEVTGVVV